MTSTLIILACLIVALLAAATDWRTSLYAWHMLRAEQKIMRLMWLCVGLIGVVIVLAGFMI